MLVVDPVGNPMNATSLPLGEGMQSPVLDMPTGGATSAKAALLIAAFDAFKSHPMGLVGFVCALSVWTMLALPVTPLEVCAGCVFGPVWGTLGSLCGKTVGCMLALTVGRVLGKAQGWQVPPAIDRYIGMLKKRPLETMVAIRVAPIPLGIKNYGLSLVQFPNNKYPVLQYFWACLIVGAPFSVMWGLTGHGASSLVEVVAKYA